jgi:hypothetical protein
MATLIVTSVSARGRWRAGHLFTREQSIVEVDESQEKLIRADDCLVVHDGGPAKVSFVESDNDDGEVAETKPARQKR